MLNGSPAAPEVPGLASLHRTFAMALSDEKFASSGRASTALSMAKSGKAKEEIVHEHFAAWREGCGLAIRKFFPQYVELGLAYPNEVTSEIVRWTEEQAWIPLCGQCGVKKYGELPPHRSLSVIWWLAVAIDGNFGVNLPDQRPWCAPRWLAVNLRETHRLIVDWSYRLSARFAGVLDEEMEAARVRVAITSGRSRITHNDLVTRMAAKRVSRQLTSLERKRREIIFGAIQMGLEGAAYCSELDRRRLVLPQLWTEQGCPLSYTDAYRKANWRKRIQDEKCRFRKRFDKTPVREREVIIEGRNSTRITRQ